MEILGTGLQAIGDAVAAWAVTVGVVYVVGLVTKTFLIFTDKGTTADFKDWFKFWGKQGL